MGGSVSPMRVLGIVALAAIALFCARLARWEEVTNLVDDPGAALTVEPVAPPDSVFERLSVAELRAQARSVGCSEATRIWWRLLNRVGDDAEAYKAIAECSEFAGVERIIDETARIFEQSRLLGVIPGILDELRVRDMIPILRQVEQRPDKDARDYLFIARALAQTGDATGAAIALQRALDIAPGSPGIQLEQGYLLSSIGDARGARIAFRNGLEHASAFTKLANFFAFTSAWPGTFLFLVASLSALAFGFVSRGRPAWSEALHRSTGLARGTILVSGAVAATVTLGLLALAFFQRGDRGAFVILCLIAAACFIWLLLSPLRKPAADAARSAGKAISALFGGKVYRRLRRLPGRQQVALLFLIAFSLVFLVPLVQQMDIRLGLLVVLSLLLFSLVGTLLLSMLRQTASLQTSLRWLAIAGTIPFLLFMLNVERERLLYTGFSVELIEYLIAYGLIWLLGVNLALRLSRILSQSIQEPVKEIMEAVGKIRRGDLTARTGVRRRDEIGELASAVDDMADGLAERARIERTFRQYVDQRVADRLIANDAAMNRGQRRHATVLFCDLRGFTNIAEDLEPEAVLTLLNEYLALMAPIVSRWGGVVDKFLGDALMGVWGVPEPVTGGQLEGIPTERLAVEAAVEMRRALDAFNARTAKGGLPSLQIGIGINAGEVVAGPLGSPDRLEYTVIGDVVNTAQRIESAARDDADILVSQSVADAVAPWVDIEERSPLLLKGKRQQQRVWYVTAIRNSVVS